MAGKKSADRNKRKLTPDEAKLWSQVAETTDPLPRAELPKADDLAEAANGEPEQMPLATSAPPLPPKPSPGDAPPGAPLDRRELRQLASGRAALSVRIDLHGMRQREAHNALFAFLQRAQAAGEKYALVITGKGAAKGRDELEPGREAPGVLKRAVPLWLDEPAFRSLVVGYGPAHARHGGGGALYVRLRRARD